MIKVWRFFPPVFMAMILIHCATTGFSQVNQVLALNGTTSYASIPSAADIQNSTEFTIEAWIYPKRPSDPNHGWFIVKGDGGSVSSQRSFELEWIHNTFIGVQMNLFLNTSTWAALSVSLVESNWVHIATTYNSASGLFQLYTNGVLAASTTKDASGTVPLVGQTLRQTSLPINLGGQGTVLANGFMDEVRIWNKVRSGAEIAGTRFCRLAGSEANLVAYWIFDDGTVKDLTSHGHTGTLLAGAAIVPISGNDIVHEGLCGVNNFPPANQVLALNGTTSYASIPSAGDIQNSTAFTMEAWIYPKRPSDPNHGWFIVKGDGGSVSSQRSYELDWNHNNTLTGAVVNLFLNTTTWANLSVSLAESNWVHIASTYNSASGLFQLYTNGVLAASTTKDASGTVPLIGQTLRQTSLPVNLGGQGTVLANGFMDEVRIWNKARSGAEIASTRFCRLSGYEANLAAYWTFDNGTLGDLTLHGHTGTLNGGAFIGPIPGTDAVHDGLCGGVLAFDSSSSSSPSGFHQRISGQSGSSISIQSSTDLMNWTSMLILPNFPGEFEFIDQTSQFFSRRFYRAVVNP